MMKTSTIVEAISILLLQQFSVVNTESHMRLGRRQFRDRCLHFHNLLRAFHGAAPLVWDEALAESSQAWANHLNTIQKMEHSEAKYGENLYSASNPADIDLICEYACKAWFNEWKFYDFENPVWSKYTGHFSQMVWKSTARVGMGEAGQAGGNFYLVARYFPPGNIDGGYEDNVLQRRKLRRSCLPNFMNMTELGTLTEALGIQDGEDYVDNSDEPCNVDELEENYPEVGTEDETGQQGVKEELGAQGKTASEAQGAAIQVATHGITGTQGISGTSGATGIADTQNKAVNPSGEAATILVGIPIPEPQGAQQSPQIIVDPSQIIVPLTHSVVTTRAPPVVSTPQPTMAVNTSLSSTTPRTPNSQDVSAVRNPARATKAFDPTPAKRARLLAKIRRKPKK